MLCVAIRAGKLISISVAGWCTRQRRRRRRRRRDVDDDEDNDHPSNNGGSDSAGSKWRVVNEYVGWPSTSHRRTPLHSTIRMNTAFSQRICTDMRIATWPYSLLHSFLDITPVQICTTENFLFRFQKIDSIFFFTVQKSFFFVYENITTAFFRKFYLKKHALWVVINSLIHELLKFKNAKP